MSMSATTDRVTYAGNGATTAFAFSYKFFADADLVVIVKNNTTGVETVKTLTTHYTVTGAVLSGVGTEAGGTVTMLTAPAAGETLIIYRDKTATQDLALDDNGKIPSANLERELDKLAMMIQRNKNVLGRTVRLPEGFIATFSTLLPGLMVNNGILKTTSTGDGFEYVSLADLINTITTGAQLFTASRALVSSAAGIATVSVTTAAEIAFISGLTSAVQTQLDLKEDRGYSTTLTAAGTTILTATSNRLQYFTGATTQTITMPVASTMIALGRSFEIVNNSTGALTVNSSGGNLIVTIPALSRAKVRCILLSGTSAASWSITSPIEKTELTTKGDLPVATAAGIITRLPAAADDKILVTDSAQAAGLAYQTYIDPSALFNLSIACSVAGNALTIALKTAAGADASATDPIRVGMRSATLTSGIISFLKCTAALSTVISSGSTAGHVSAQECEIYVGLLNNAGALELCWSAFPFDENILQSTTAEGGAGAADVSSTLYSTVARSNVAVRMIGRLLSTQTTAGTWAAVPTNVQVGSLQKFRGSDLLNQQVYLTNGNGYGSTNTKIRRYTNSPQTATDMVYADSATNGMSITVGKWGTYAMHRADSTAAANLDLGISLNSNQLTANVSTITAANRVAIWEMPTTGAANSAGVISATRFLGPGDVIRAHDNLASTDTGVYSWFLMTRVR